MVFSFLWPTLSRFFVKRFHPSTLLAAFREAAFHFTKSIAYQVTFRAKVGTEIGFLEGIDFSKRKGNYSRKELLLKLHLQDFHLTFPLRRSIFEYYPGDLKATAKSAGPIRNGPKNNCFSVLVLLGK